MSSPASTTGSKSSSGSILGNVGDVNIKFDTLSMVTAGGISIFVVIFGVIFSKIVNKFF